MRPLGACVLVGALIATSLAACGLDAGGSATGDDGGSTTGDDGGGDAILGSDGGADGSMRDGSSDQAAQDANADVPPTCATIDTSCLGATVPGGWILLGLHPGTATCPSADFDPFAFVTSPRLRGDTCECEACATQGSWACNGFQMKFGQTCSSSSLLSGMSPSCVAHSESGANAKVAATPPAPSGNVTCSSAPAGTGLVDTDPITACRPNKCQADYCGLRARGFATCILHDDVVACPPGFAQQTIVGSSGAASCVACPCTISPAACTGSVRVFDNVRDCDGNGSVSGPNFRAEVPADGTCQNPNGNFDSLYYVPGPAPQPACTPSARTGGQGTADLVGTKTVCCTQ